MKHLLNLLLLLFFANVYSQSPDQNYTHFIEPKIKLSITNFEELNYDVDTEIFESIDYTDGFGTKLQTVDKKTSPSLKDMIVFYENDEFGREEKKYFPFSANQNNLSFAVDAKEQQKIYYQTVFNDYTPFTQSVFENSPLNRIMKSSRGSDARQVVPGSNTDKTLKSVYATNDANEIQLYTVNTTGQIISSSFYNKGTLQKNIAKNENWVPADGDLNTAQVFIDDSGRKIAEINFVLDDSYLVKKVLTQFVYDSKGLLRYIISPQNANYDFQSYLNSTTLKFPYKKFLSDENISGGGSDVTVSLNSSVLSVTFNAGFSAVTLKTGPIVFLDSRIPNTNLGNITCTPCSGNYRLYTENGYLCIGLNTYHVAATNISGTYSANIGINFTFNSSQDVLDKYTFQYRYDDYNRLIEQKTPGKGWEYSVFDQLDRPVISQDENLRQQGKWLFTKYDVFDRVTYTGSILSSLNRADMQLQLDNYYAGSSASNFEARSSTVNSIGGMNVNYSNTSFPTTINEVTSVTYYDDYTFNDPDKPMAPPIVNGQLVTTQTHGLLTCNIKKTIGSNTFTKIFNYYDEEARVVYSFDKNYLGGNTQSETTYNFRNKITRSKTTHKKDASAASIVVDNRYEYDHAERLKKEFQQIDSQAEELLAEYVYDNIGNLFQKKVGGAASSATRLQTIEYSRNILGWLTKINNPDNLGSSLFGLQIKYDDPGSSTPGYNGNISQVRWKNSMPSSGLKTYDYTYDNLNRLKVASYKNSNNPSHTTSFGERINYDINGNITFFHRSGDVLSQGNLEWMDYMYYNYDGNRLAKVDELGHGHAGYESYLTTGSSLNTYEYDANGNMTKDRNKDIDNIVYNDLNLIKEITFVNGNKIKYYYDASGAKLSKEYIVGSNTTTTQYINGFQYLNGTLQFFPSSGGYVVNSGGTYKYVYLYNDHLGNNRLSYCDMDGNNSISSAEILSATDYYAYGMTHSGEFTSGFASTFLYKFQGKEFNNEGNLKLFDFGSRMFDPYLGRWVNPDPQNQFISPYVALGNNPVRFVDPNGEFMGWDDALVCVIGGVINVASNWNDIEDFGDAAAYFGVGAAAGIATYYTGGNPVLGGVIMGMGNNTIQQYKRNKGFKNFNAFEVTSSGVIGGVSAFAGGKVGDYFTSKMGSYLGSHIESKLVSAYLTKASASYMTGFTLGFSSTVLFGGSYEDGIQQGFASANIALVSQTLTFGFEYNKGVRTKQEAKAQKQSTEQAEAQKSLKALDEQITKTQNEALKSQKTASNGTFKSLSELGMNDGMKVSSSKALELGQQFLGKGYTEPVPGSGRYVSQDGTRVFRMGTSDITGAHGGGPHVNFETLVPNPAKPGKMMVKQNFHVYLTD